MKNILAILSGITALSLSAVSVAFVLINFGVEPFHKFAVGNFYGEEFFKLAQKIITLYVLVVFPIISFIAGLAAGLVAKDREYLIGLICVTPLLIIFYDFSKQYLLIILSTTIFVVLGVKTAKKIKHRSFRGI